MVAHCLRAYPEEGCGLLVGEPATSTRPQRGADSATWPRRPRSTPSTPAITCASTEQAEADGLAVIGVFHSHTHTDPYPSPTDVAQAPDPSWHYVLVSLRHEVASSVRTGSLTGAWSRRPIEVH